MDAGKTRDLQMALWNAVMANRAVPARLGADIANDETASPQQPKGGLPAVVVPHPRVELPVSPRVAVPVGGYSVNLSAAAVAASHEPLPRLRALQPAAANDPKAETKPASAASAAARVNIAWLELSTDDGILSVAQPTPRAPGAIPAEGITVAPPLPPLTPGEVRFPRGAFPTAEEGARPAMQAPPSTTPSPTGLPERLDARSYNDPAIAMNVAPRAPAPELMGGTNAAPPAPPEMLVRTDAPPAHMTPAAFAAAAQLAAAEEAKAASRLLPRPAGELMHHLLGSQDSPAPTPEFYRLIVGAAALAALLLLVL